MRNPPTLEEADHNLGIFIEALPVGTASRIVHHCPPLTAEEREILRLDRFCDCGAPLPSHRPLWCRDDCPARPERVRIRSEEERYGRKIHQDEEEQAIREAWDGSIAASIALARRFGDYPVSRALSLNRNTLVSRVRRYKRISD